MSPFNDRLVEVQIEALRARADAIMDEAERTGKDTMPELAEVVHELELLALPRQSTAEYKAKGAA